MGVAARRRQRGQAIVLIAIMLAVLVGMAALAIDGSRAYQSKRSLQASVDGAALAGADTLQQTRNFVTAEQAATTSFSANRRLYTAPGCAPGYGTPGAAPLTITCTYSDGTVLTQVVAQLGPAGYAFTLTATRSLALQFGRILTNGVSPIISASSSASVDNLLYSPTLAALSQGGCGGVPGTAITVNGGGNLQVIGDVVSNGAISVTGGNEQVGGDVYARCQAAVPGLSLKCYPSGSSPGCTYPDVAGVTRTGYRFVDPNYPPPPVVGGSQSAVGTNVVMFPGTYAANPNFVGGDCWFLKGGVYYWNGGYTNNGDFVSNELKPPDEPKISDNTQVSPKQFWNGDGAQCAGAYQLSTQGGPNQLPNANWAFVVTSLRLDVYNGFNYPRESAPSVCRTIRTTGGNGVVKIDISNVPGATSYNVYATRSGGDCSGPWGLIENIPVVGTVSNFNTSSCPLFTGSGCTLGHESAIIDDNDIIGAFAPNAAAAWGTYGSYPPSPETSPLGGNLPNENAERVAPPAGDKANENECLTVGGAQASCPSAITPGAVSYVIPNGACLTDTSAGDTYVFSGYQYDWLLVYEPGLAYPPANSCSNTMGAATDTAFIGLIYMPAAAVTIQKATAFRTDETGGVIANTISFTGQLPTIIGNDAYSPVQPGSRLTS
ncbi:MAG TPA: TadE/TadG family type IV pilus assembly protein [Candidatus Dormibacteraeota bacterium]|jgi:Flp pilus assembly protein TadG|nr:TadE/TadG family type IV pilus assembly protein [Candidatus Dormibacteraeota bacterium]